MLKKVALLVGVLLIYSLSAYAYNIPMKYLEGDENISFFVRMDNVTFVELNDSDKQYASFNKAMRLEILSMTCEKRVGFTYLATYDKQSRGISKLIEAKSYSSNGKIEKSTNLYPTSKWIITTHGSVVDNAVDKILEASRNGELHFLKTSLN